MFEFIRQNQTLMWWLGAASVITFIGTLVLIPVLVVRIPEDYFIRSRQGLVGQGSRHPILVIGTLVAKNVVGAVFIITGIALLLAPGQGLLTILLGVLLLDFPGKRRLELALIRRHAVLSAVNWIRRRAGHAPLKVDGITPER